MTRPTDSAVPLAVDDRTITPAELLAVARDRRPVALATERRWRGKVEASRAALEAALAAGRPVYGVTTGVGFSSGKAIAADGLDSFAVQIVHQHGCGVGEPLSVTEARAVVMARLVSLAKGCSAVRLELLVAMAELLNRDVTPRIPRFGSVGASGDLTPLSYVVSVLMGEREAVVAGDTLAAAEALARVGLAPLAMVPKEQLAIMNGTSVMTAVGIVAAVRFARLLDLAERSSALAAEVMLGRSEAYHPAAHAVKPHPGQVQAAAAIRAAIAGSGLMDTVKDPDRIIQDPYSIRCAPHVLGAARDALAWVDQVLTQELNSVNDNPLVDGTTGDILFAGNFYGGHVALAMDLLKVAAASVGDLLDRQLALLVDSRFNLGLPETLVGYPGCGVKGLQITASALAALAVQRSASDTVTSRPTEVNNQDKVSMGTNAALNASEVVGHVQGVLAALMIALANAAALRDERRLSPAAGRLVAAIRVRSPRLEADRRLDQDLARLVAMIDDAHDPS